MELKKHFPFYDVFSKFLEEYASCYTYWYIPKARALNEESIITVKKSLKVIFDDFLEQVWNQDTQDKLLNRLRTDGLLEPYKEGIKQDRTALSRIHKKLWEVLGLAWVEENSEIIITDAGLELLPENTDHRPIIETQIARWQYPNPSVRLEGFKGILPHVFLLQVLQQVDYRIAREEFDLFLNLARSQDDLDRIVRYIKHWRDLKENEQQELHDIVETIPMAEATTQLSLLPSEEAPTRFRRIKNDSSYQRDFFTYPRYLRQENGDIICTSREQVDIVANEKFKNLKISFFRNKADWFAYYGDPEQRPSWLTYLTLEIEKAETKQEAEKIVQEAHQQLTPQETEEIAEEIQRKEVEKEIESFYVKNLPFIEKDLELFKNDDQDGRQFSTPIGRIDLLCEDRSKNYVVVEIKAGEADDATFGQILRYIGWVYRNLANGQNVRGIILAGAFPDKARYSRIGLEPLNKNYKKFLGFKEHGLTLQDT